MEPILRRREDMEWIAAPMHERLFQQSLISPEEADKLNLHLWQVLREKIEPGGAVLPHTHDVTEVIHFIQGEVSVLWGGQRTSCRPGGAITAPPERYMALRTGAKPLPSRSAFSSPVEERKISATPNSRPMKKSSAIQKYLLCLLA